MRIQTSILTLAALLSLAGMAHSAEFASEPFDGTLATSLSGTGSGTGWAESSTWSGPAGTTYGTNITFIASGTNSIGLVDSSGAAAAIASSNDHSRTLSQSYTVGDDTGAGEHPVVYLSFLFENATNPAPGHAFRVVLRNGTTLVTSFGKEVNAAWRLRDSDEISANVTTNYNATYFAVVKMEYDAGTSQTTITGYLAEDSDNNLDLTDLATYPRTATLTTAGKVTFDNVLIDTNNNATARLDEIRLGDDLANVSATPDPLLVVDDPATFTTDNAPEILNLEISNAGTSNDLTITAVTPGGTDGTAFSIDPLDLPLTIPAGSSDFLPITFTPNGTYQASYSATLEIVSNDSGSPKTITIDVTNNPDPWIQVAASVSFENNGVATSYSIPVTNLGLAESLQISGVTVDGLDAPTVSGLTIPGTIAPGLSDDVTFTFTPDSGLGPYDILLTINSDDPATPSKVVTVTIVVAEPLIAVDTALLDFGVLSNSPGAIDLPVTVTNDGGTLDLTIADTTAITGSGAFTILSPSLPVVIAPGGSTDLTVRFDPGTNSGRFTGTLAIQSNDSNGTTPTVTLRAFVDPAGTVVARYDFDPSQLAATVVDLDGSGASDWTTGDLTDVATGIGAISQGNQTTSNRILRTGANGNYLALSCARESDAQTPLAAGGNNESTWTTFTVTPDAGGGSIDFTGGTAVIDTYANTDQNSNTAADWTLYYSIDGGSTWTSLGTQAGQSTTASGTFGPLGLSWDLTSLGIQTSAVDFIIDPVATANTNGTVSQRGVGFDNLVLTAGSVTPGSGGDNFGTWASGFGIPNDPDHDATDNDGIPALVEYALGLDPTVSETLADTFDPATGLLSFSKGTAAVTNGDVTYSIETSTDLGDADLWTAVDEVDLEEGTASDPSSISYTLPTGEIRIFARLVVTQIP